MYSAVSGPTGSALLPMRGSIGPATSSIPLILPFAPATPQTVTVHVDFWTGLAYTLAAALVGALGHMAAELFRWRAEHRQRGRRKYDH